jgi:hypothetical protein
VSVLAELRRAVADSWLDGVLGDGTKFRAAFAGAGRRLGTAPIGEEAAARICAAGLVLPATAGVDECARAALLLAATSDVTLVRDLLRRGEVRERQAVLRVLAALPDAPALVDVAVDACRTNIVPVFAAIANDNAYPARYFPDAAYFQLVLKALFVEVPLARVVGLAERTTPELVRMVDAFASERRAAGRAVPADVELVRRPS